jgi:hypothetical protein
MLASVSRCSAKARLGRLETQAELGISADVAREQNKRFGCDDIAAVLLSPICSTGYIAARRPAGLIEDLAAPAAHYVTE